MHAQAQNKKIKNRRKRKTLRGKFNLNRHQLPFVLLAFPSFYLFICCYFFLFICCASLACIVYISLNGYLFAFYFYVRKQREIRLGLDFSVFLFLFFFILLFCYGLRLCLRLLPLPSIFLLLFANVFYGVLKTTLLNKLVAVLFLHKTDHAF